MTVPCAQLLRVTRQGFDPADNRDTNHFRLYQSFTVDPVDFLSRGFRGETYGLW